MTQVATTPQDRESLGIAVHQHVVLERSPSDVLDFVRARHSIRTRRGRISAMRCLAAIQTQPPDIDEAELISRLVERT